jgi:hypothetical protein
MDSKDEIFSEEYDTSEKTETKEIIVPSEVVNEQTSVSEQGEYSISKPRRFIIKAIVKND